MITYKEHKLNIIKGAMQLVLSVSSIALVGVMVVSYV